MWLQCTQNLLVTSAIFRLSYCSDDTFRCYLTVHCRTGSLEVDDLFTSDEERVHCRTGSLEDRLHSDQRQ